VYDDVTLQEQTTDASIKLMMLPSDIALLKDDKLRPWVINVFFIFFIFFLALLEDDAPD
jgi:hypothetical protein